jgi:GNAT superfamily N-acetyltransferase
MQAKQWGNGLLTPARRGRTVANAARTILFSAQRHPVDGVCVKQIDPTSAAAVELIAALDGYLSGLYPQASLHLLPPASFKDPRGVFFGAFMDERLVGCCGYVTHGGGCGELKRLFVRPEARGRGIGRLLLAAAEEHARAAGLEVLRTETGVSQPDAVRLCERAGYARRGPFGDYPDDPLSVFMEKRLDAEPSVLRHDLRPGDLGSIIRLHGKVYARENSFDPTFEAYVAGPLADFALRRSERERLWIAEHTGRLAGCIAVVAASGSEAQLRWFLVAPSARRAGLGRRLLREAVAFAFDRGYMSMFLWTVSALEAAARLYRSFGFELTEERAGERWGVRVVEQRYDLRLSGVHPSTSHMSQDKG